jgi:hypothetical protein
MRIFGKLFTDDNENEEIDNDDIFLIEMLDED